MARSGPGEMSLSEHLAELRRRLVRFVGALLVGTVVGYVVFDPIFAVLIAPYCDLPAAFRVVEPGGVGDCRLVALSPLEPFAVRMKTALLVGAFLAAPVGFYQLWRFVTPGLTSRERGYALPFVLASQVMFALGLVFAYLVFPLALRVLLGFGGEAITPQLTADAYLSFVLRLAVAFGAAFELPLVLIFLSAVGVLSSTTLRRYRAHAITGIAILSAIITPADLPSMVALMVPLTLFYEGSILAAWLIERRRRRA